ncbi:MAG: hypothetical protein LUG18_14850 [Candidatus Azobacteroides sp.]|nr:hypothetical protein [Candidatus Azobacteroides sp.]
MKIKNLLLGLFSVLVLMSSCSQIFPPDIDSDEALDEVINALNEVDKDTYKIKYAKVTEKEKLSSEFGMLYISLQDMEGKEYSQNIFYNMPTDGGEIKEDLIQSKKKKDVKPLDIDAINKENIRKYIEEAKGMIPEGYSFKSMGGIEFNSDKEGNLIYKLTLNATEDGNSTKVQGRNIVTEYYEFTYDVDKDGNVTMKD